MKKKLAGMALALSAIASSQIPTPKMNQILTGAANSLAEAQFDSNVPVTIRGRVSTLVWPEGTSGMLIIEASQGGEKYAFSTARVAAMAKQGFTRFALHPGEEVIVSGVLASGKTKIGPGLNAARADLITKSDGSRVFDRSKLP
jgi:hypothetical protein